ncbi:MAG: hypothetical protein J7639_24780 [Paenibacillaceae bacterium]|nr:hypothetical protein [Paenibacillaceae bacterium]
MPNMHDLAYDAVCRLLDQVAVPFRQYIERFTPAELTRPFVFGPMFMDFHPYDQFRVELPNVEFSFLESCRWWATYFGAAEEDRFARILFERVREIVLGQLEVIRENEAQLEQQKFILERSLTA